eukprot:TRINITY_DN12447_c0_g1_i1.p1 TRINITY_DN12447_c0_g1~~TRINITY_DN12447_c0_g1_i1.p1  ORF type:complete len:484 (+),score=121.84 TRINITY_DN12447_c0_g1_i1:29-1453(+)
MSDPVAELTTKVENLPAPSSDGDGEEEKAKIHADKLYEEGIKKVTVQIVNDSEDIKNTSDQPLKSNNPFTSAKTFEELKLKPELLRGIAHKKFDKPSKIQAEALPIILSKFNLIAQAQSGSGKTAAFTLGILSNIDTSLNYPQAVVVSPTRELTRQTESVVKELGQYMTDLRIFLAVPSKEQVPPQLGAQVVIGTPGKIKDLFLKRKIDPRQLRVLVLDEADDLLGSGDGTSNEDHIAWILKAVEKVSIQKLLFSATWPPKILEWSKRRLLTNRKEKSAILTLSVEQLSVSTITQFSIRCNGDAGKNDVLEQIFLHLNVGQSIIFVKSRNTAQFLANTLKSKHYPVSMIFGGTMDPQLRDQSIDDFRKGVTRNLISTDLLSRGIDVLNVNVVINYDLPSDAETYLHRIGRTGRYGKQGVAINLLHDQQSEALLHTFQNFYKKEIIPIREEEISTTLNDRINMTLDSYGLSKTKK